MPIASALRTMMLDPAAGWLKRGNAARLLKIADGPGATGALLDLFFSQTDRIGLWETVLSIERGADPAAVPRLVDALSDPNSDRRHAAARVLGWNWPVGRQAAKALILALLDKSQPQPVREEAAESLAYSNYKHAIPPLISVLDEPDVGLRFWAVFALGGIGRRERGVAYKRAIEALERMVPDSKTHTVVSDPNSSPEDLHWAKGYSL